LRLAGIMGNIEKLSIAVKAALRLL